VSARAQLCRVVRCLTRDQQARRAPGLTTISAAAARQGEVWRPSPGSTACRERNSSTRTCEALGSSGLTYLSIHGGEDDGLDIPIFTTVTPSYAEVLEVRAGRVGMVRDFLATVTSDELAATRKNPWAPEHQDTTLSCLQVILDEEWEHHRYAVRDLDAIEAKSDSWADDRSSPSSSFSLPAAT
jgi:DinB superfamily